MSDRKWEPRPCGDPELGGSTMGDIMVICGCGEVVVDQPHDIKLSEVLALLRKHYQEMGVLK